MALKHFLPVKPFHLLFEAGHALPMRGPYDCQSNLLLAYILPNLPNCTGDDKVWLDDHPSLFAHEMKQHVIIIKTLSN